MAAIQGLIGGSQQIDGRSGAGDGPPHLALRGFRAAAVDTPGAPAQLRQVGGVALAWVGRPYLPGVGADAFDARLAERFRADGAAVLDALRGDFALAAYDEASGRGIVATDRMGIQPLFIRIEHDRVAFGSTPQAVRAQAGIAPEVDPQALFDYFHAHVVPAPRSVLKGVERLLPGECVRWTAMRAERAPYWRAEFVEDRDPGFAHKRSGFLDALRSAVARATDGARCGAFLSGGTDSSTIVGLMSEAAGGPVDTYSIGFEAAGYDEMEYARLAARHFGARHHEYYVTPDDIVAAVPLLARTHVQPFGNSSAVPAYFCARLAAGEGIERMIGGDGGDELFGGNARYAKQRVFALYDALPPLLRHALIEPAARVAARAGRVPVLSKAVSYVQQASVPMPDRLETYNLLNRLGARALLSPALLDAVDVDEPTRLNRAAFANPTAHSLINRMLALDFKTTLADNDLPKVMQSCAAAGVGAVFPMLDAPVVDFSLALPPRDKLRGTRLRHFFKEALTGFLPQQIIDKEKHGFGLPYGEWAMRHERLRQLTFDSIASFGRRGWVNRAMVDRLVNELMPAHPNYYGTLAWLMLMLEQWLQCHIDPLPRGTAR